MAPSGSSTVAHVPHLAAYLDGGTISLVVAAIAGAVAGVGVYAQSVLQRIRKFIQKLGSRSDNTDQDSDQ